MTISEKRLGISSLIFAGLWSLFFSLLGCFEILGDLFVYIPLRMVAPYFLLVLEFPLFVLATVFSRRFIIPLWAMTAIYPIALILLAREIFIQNLFIALVTGTGTISFAILAALLRYGTRFYSSPGAKLAKLWHDCAKLWHDSKGIEYHRKF